MTIEFLLNKLTVFRINCRRFQPERIIPPYFDFLWSFIRFGCAPDDYYQYEFYKKSNYERNKFLTWRRCQKIIDSNDKNQKKLLDDKALFNKEFGRFVKRDWIDLRESCEEDFMSFLQKHKKVIIKPVDGGQGKGVYLLSCNDIGSKDFSFDSLKNAIAEEVIEQHTELARFNPSSVNTVRVYTFKGRIISTALRTGGGNGIVDNLHSGGVCAHIDEETGIIDCLCRNYNMDEFLIHPVSGVKMIGFQVPNWKMVLEIAIEASSLIPSVPYIGWDVAVRQNDVELIEGNCDADHNLMQMIDQRGRYCIIKDICKTINV